MLECYKSVIAYQYVTGDNIENLRNWRGKPLASYIVGGKCGVDEPLEIEAFIPCGEHDIGHGKNRRIVRSAFAQASAYGGVGYADFSMPAIVKNINNTPAIGHPFTSSSQTRLASVGVGSLRPLVGSAGSLMLNGPFSSGVYNLVLRGGVVYFSGCAAHSCITALRGLVLRLPRVRPPLIFSKVSNLGLGHKIVSRLARSPNLSWLKGIVGGIVGRRTQSSGHVLRLPRVSPSFVLPVCGQLFRRHQVCGFLGHSDQLRSSLKCHNNDNMSTVNRIG